MELPFTIVFEPPSQEELRALLRMRGTWVAGLLAVLAIGTCVLVANVGHADAVASTPPVSLELTSRPTGASVWLDGREHGRTPLELLLEPGSHSVVLKSGGMLDAEYAIQADSAPRVLDAVLLRRQPTLLRLRPTLPGAVLSDVRPLADGQLALALGLPPGRQLQAWRLDPLSGEVQPLLSDTLSARLAVAPDGQHIAYLGDDIGAPAAGTQPASYARVLWLVSAGRSAPNSGWRAPLASGEGLLDVSWSPQSDRVLAISSQVLTGGASRSRLWFLESDGDHAREVLSVPSDVVLGSEVWSPDGQRVAFVAHAGQVNALCLLDLDGSFRYVADLDPASTPRLAYPPAVWSADSQRLLFVAPHQHPPGVPLNWLQTDTRHALLVATASEPIPTVVGDTDVDLAGWREDGRMLGLGRPTADGGLVVSLIGAAGNTHRLLDLPLRPASDYAALWDTNRARILVANLAPSGGIEYWLAMLGAEAAP